MRGKSPLRPLRVHLPRKGGGLVLLCSPHCGGAPRSSEGGLWVERL
jgi:hypothetical protein